MSTNLRRSPTARLAVIAGWLGFGILIVSGCGDVSHPPAVPASTPLTATGPVTPPARIDAPHLANAHRITPTVIAGAQPEGAVGFKELQALGVKTIISVDGATPDLALAHQFGMTYVHLPFGYDGIPPGRQQELAKAITELPGPFYIHCHHGKHRGAAAAATACVIAGLISNEQALADMKAMQTGENYVGLWAAARQARPADPAALHALHVEFKESTPLEPLPATMVKIDDCSERLQSCQAAGWKTPGAHPDLDPAHEALMLREYFTELQRSDDFAGRPAEFQKWLKDAAKNAQSLEDTLGTLQKSPENGPALPAIDGVYASLQNSCTTCHKLYRNIPHR